MAVTTIKLGKKTVERLNRLKIHPRQPYEEVILKMISESKKSHESFYRRIKPDSGRDLITTIKLSKNTAKVLNKLKIHPRQPYEEVILNFISENEKIRKRSR